METMMFTKGDRVHFDTLPEWRGDISKEVVYVVADSTGTLVALDGIFRPSYSTTPDWFSPGRLVLLPPAEAPENHNETDTQSARDTQVGGDHYSKLAIQPFEYSHKNGLGPLEHTAIKYLTRWRDKDGIKDLRKAIHAIEFLIEMETPNV
jgi:hypothetical protein